MYFYFDKCIESKLYRNFIYVPKVSVFFFVKNSFRFNFSAQCHDKQLEIVGNRCICRYSPKSGNQIKLTLFGKK